MCRSSIDMPNMMMLHTRHQCRLYPLATLRAVVSSCDVTSDDQQQLTAVAACCRGAGQGPSDAGLTSAQFSLAYERHERVGKISTANAAQKTLVPGVQEIMVRLRAR